MREMSNQIPSFDAARKCHIKKLKIKLGNGLTDIGHQN